MLVAGLPPAVVKRPAAYRSRPDTASANTVVLASSSGGRYKTPEPSALQVLPSHLAMFVAGLPPAVVNPPPTYKLLPDTASAYTDDPGSNPELSGLQFASLKVESIGGTLTITVIELVAPAL